jgi:sigma-B regulation protein RsbU (phosphoserine phosphatase)
MPATDSRRDPKQLYRRLDSLLAHERRQIAPGRLLELFLDDLFESAADELNVSSGALYREKGKRFVPAKGVNVSLAGAPKDLGPAHPTLERVLAHGTYIFPDPSDEASPGRAGLLPAGPAVGVAVGERPTRHALLFGLADGWTHEQTDLAMNTLRAALGHRLDDNRLHGTIKEAAAIQRSLLVETAPTVPGYDIAFLTLPADEVGGDFFDFIDFDGDSLGIAVGDSSGHGLPAALLVRDVVTGLRMGLEKDLKLVPVFTKLNRVIHRSHLSSRFVSLFYGELEPNGNLTYVNAGHPPPLLFIGDHRHELTVGGTVIGPLPEVRFKRGFAHVDRGATLLHYTDGLVERHNAAGEEFGVERLAATVRSAWTESAATVLERIFEAARAFGGDQRWEDDATAVVVKREAQA